MKNALNVSYLPRKKSFRTYIILILITFQQGILVRQREAGLDNDSR